MEDPEPRDADDGDELEAAIVQADHAFGAESVGTTAEEGLEGESLDQRLAEEEPGSAEHRRSHLGGRRGSVRRRSPAVGDAVHQRDEFASPEEAALSVRDSVPGATDHDDPHPARRGLSNFGSGQRRHTVRRVAAGSTSGTAGRGGSALDGAARPRGLPPGGQGRGARLLRRRLVRQGSRRSHREMARGGGRRLGADPRRHVSTRGDRHRRDERSLLRLAARDAVFPDVRAQAFTARNRMLRAWRSLPEKLVGGRSMDQEVRSQTIARSTSHASGDACRRSGGSGCGRIDQARGAVLGADPSSYWRSRPSRAPVRHPSPRLIRASPSPPFRGLPDVPDVVDPDQAQGRPWSRRACDLRPIKENRSFDTLFGRFARSRRPSSARSTSSPGQVGRLRSAARGRRRNSRRGAQLHIWVVGHRTTAARCGRVRLPGERRPDEPLRLVRGGTDPGVLGICEAVRARQQVFSAVYGPTGPEQMWSMAGSSAGFTTHESADPPQSHGSWPPREYCDDPAERAFRASGGGGRATRRSWTSRYRRRGRSGRPATGRRCGRASRAILDSRRFPGSQPANGVSWRQYRGENEYVDPLRQILERSSRFQRSGSIEPPLSSTSRTSPRGSCRACPGSRHPCTSRTTPPAASAKVRTGPSRC